MVKAGRELDALVATEIMGWVRQEPKECDGSLGEIPGGGCFCECGWSGNWGDADHLDTRGSTPPNYSESIAAAWEVLERLASQGWNYRLANDWVELFDHSRHVLVKEGGAYGICLAALKAVGINALSWLQ